MVEKYRGLFRTKRCSQLSKPQLLRLCEARAAYYTDTLKIPAPEELVVTPEMKKSELVKRCCTKSGEPIPLDLVEKR